MLFYYSENIFDNLERALREHFVKQNILQNVNSKSRQKMYFLAVDVKISSEKMN